MYFQIEDTSASGIKIYSEVFQNKYSVSFGVMVKSKTVHNIRVAEQKLSFFLQIYVVLVAFTLCTLDKFCTSCSYVEIYFQISFAIIGTQVDFVEYVIA